MPLNTVKARLFRAHRTIHSWIENRTAPEPARDLDHGG